MGGPCSQKMIPGTSDIMIFDFDLDGPKVYLVDTPGFNDTHKSDAETLTTVATYLVTSFAQKCPHPRHPVSSQDLGQQGRRKWPAQYRHAQGHYR